MLSQRALCTSIFNIPTTFVQRYDILVKLQPNSNVPATFIGRCSRPDQSTTLPQRCGNVLC